MDVNVADDALLVDYKDGALAAPVLAQDAVLLRHGTVGEEIAQERVGYAAQAVRPGFEAGDAVNGETQDLGLHPIEPVEQRLVRRDLRRSDGRPGKGEKCQDDIASAVLGKTDFPVFMVFKGEIGGWFSKARGHSFISLGIV